MPRPKMNTVLSNFRLSLLAKAKLEELSREHGMSQTAIIEAIFRAKNLDVQIGVLLTSEQVDKLITGGTNENLPLANVDSRSHNGC